MAGICRTINRGIGNLDAATSLDVVRKNATDASGLYEDGVNELKKLTIPTSDKQFASDMKDMITSFEDQLDTLDAIAKAAKENDQATVDSRMSKLTKQAKDSNDLADSLNISRCQLDPVFTASDTVPATIPATTPTTEAPVPLTLPIATEPPTTIPPPTTFPVSTPHRFPATSRSSRRRAWCHSATTPSPTHPARPPAGSRRCSTWLHRWPRSPVESAPST